MIKNIKTFLLGTLTAVCTSTMAQTTATYGYAPILLSNTDSVFLGLNGKSGLISAAVCLDPAEDSVVSRLKGRRIKGIQVLMHHAYANGKKQRRCLVRVASGTPDNSVYEQLCSFSEGVNDILLDTTLTVGSEPLYLEAQVYETLGTPLPFVAYGGASVEGGCWMKLKDQDWTSYTDRGSLCLRAILDDETLPLAQPTAYVQNVSHPQKVAPVSDFNGTLYVLNQTGRDMSTVEIAMQGEGDTNPTLRTLSLSPSLATGHATVVNANLRAGKGESTEALWTVWAEKADGQKLLPSRRGKTRLAVSVDDFSRVPLVEEFTSQYCLNCPFMAYYLDEAMEQYREEGHPLIYLTRHVGFREDAFTCEADRVLEFLNQDHGNPSVMYNRTVFEGREEVVFGANVAESEPYLTNITEAGSQFALSKVDVTADRSDQGVAATVSGRMARNLVGQPVRLSVYLVEDSISTDRFPQLGLDDETAPADLKQRFKHNGIIRATYNADPEGDLITPDDEGNFTVTYPAVALLTDRQAEPVKYWTENNMRVVAVVHKYNKDNLRDNYVLNAAETHWQTTGITTVNVQPRPAQDVIYNLQGQRLSRPTRGICIVNGRKVMY